MTFWDNVLDGFFFGLLLFVAWAFVLMVAGVI